MDGQSESKDQSGGDESAREGVAMSPREQIEFNREINALEQEGKHLTACQKHLRLNVGCDEAAAEDLHGDLVEFLRGRSAEVDAIGLSEVAVALWDELTRIEMGLKNSENSSIAMNDGDDGSTQSGTPESTTPQTTLDSDPMFQ